MTVHAVVYDADGITQHDDIAAAKAESGTTWVRVEAATGEEIDAVAEVFDLHRLAIEDIVNGVRPKTEEFTDYTFVLVKTAELTTGETTFDKEVHEEPVGVFVGDDWVVSLSAHDDDPIGRVWEAVVRGDERFLHRGPAFTAYRVVDEYFSLLDRTEDDIETIEEVLDSTDGDVLEEITAVRRDLLSFRKLAWPTRKALSVLARGDPKQVEPETEKHFRDVYDHLVRVVDLVETYRDLVSGARDIYLNTLSQSSNEVMKTLTVIATIFLPLTFVAGVYGMTSPTAPTTCPNSAGRSATPRSCSGCSCSDCRCCGRSAGRSTCSLGARRRCVRPPRRGRAFVPPGPSPVMSEPDVVPTVRVYADYVCPFCYLGYASLEAYREDREGPLDVEWHPFDLRSRKRRPDGTIDPSIDDGKDDSYYEEARRNVRRLAEEYNVEMAQHLRKDVDSYGAQRVALRVREEHPEAFEAFHRGVFDALWEKGRDVGDASVLADIAEAAGLPAGYVPDVLADDDSADALEDAFEAAAEFGITGVPTFVHDEYAARGAVPPEQLARLVEGS